MALSINVNVPSLNAQRNLNRSGGALATSLQRLSSGLRLNSAKDDAAGMAIATRFTSQIRGLNQAARNANDGISLAQTAEGALEETVNNLQRLRELSIQSANATNSVSDRASLQAEVKELVAEITRVGDQTAFNGTTMLDGSFSTQKFQIGANANQTISIASISDARSTALGSQTMTLDGTATGGTLAAGADVTAGNTIAAEADLTLTTVDGGSTTAISYAANAGADAIASAINTAAGSIGITATATNTATLSGMGSTGTVTMTLNGSAISATVTNTGDLTSVMSSINGKTGATGITASFTSSTAKDSLTLTTTDGRDINVLDFTHDGTTATVNFSGAALSGVVGSSTLTLDGTITGNAKAAAIDLTGGNLIAAETDLTLTTDAGTSAAISYGALAGADAIASAINTAASSLGITATATNTATLDTLLDSGNVGMTLNGTVIAPVAVTTGDLTALRDAINTAGITGLTAALGGSSASLVLTTSDGSDISILNFTNSVTAGGGSVAFSGEVLTTAGSDSSIKVGTVALSSSQGQITTANAEADVFAAAGVNTGTVVVASSTTDSSIKVGTVDLSSSQGQITSANAAADVFAAAGTNTSTLSAVSAMDISTDTGAQSAITVIDAALSMVNSIRGSLGAIQNRFSSTVASIQTTSENLSASRSRIQDTDFASETAALTRGQILQQAGIAMLSQANSLPQAVLSLLQ